MKIVINEPTRVTKSTKSILDVCITSSRDKIIPSGVVHLGISDHSLIYATRKLNSVIKGDTITADALYNIPQNSFNLVQFYQ